jgi:hypothetical protein
LDNQRIFEEEVSRDQLFAYSFLKNRLVSFVYQDQNFTNPFYVPPSIIVTANHREDSSNPFTVRPENNAINVWIEVGRISRN